MIKLSILQIEDLQKPDSGRVVRGSRITTLPISVFGNYL